MGKGGASTTTVSFRTDWVVLSLATKHIQTVRNSTLTYGGSVHVLSSLRFGRPECTGIFAIVNSAEYDPPMCESTRPVQRRTVIPPVRFNGWCTFSAPKYLCEVTRSLRLERRSRPSALD